jgi:hypothetical protein
LVHPPSPVTSSSTDGSFERDPLARVLDYGVSLGSLHDATVNSLPD